MVQLLARVLNGRLRLVIVGRNEAAAKDIIASLPATTGEGASYEFLPCDVNVMKNVHDLSEALRDRLPKINFLILSAGVFSLKGWEETEDGLDKKLVGRYYSRWALTNDLLPLLRNAEKAGEDAKVMSILGAGKYAGIDVNDLGLKKSFSGLKAMGHSLSYNDLMMAVSLCSIRQSLYQDSPVLQEFAERNAEISFIHIFPGNVRTNSFTVDHWLLMPFSPLLKLIFRALAIEPEVCAEHMLYALLDTKKGLSRRNEKGDDVGDLKFPKVEGAQQKLWDHSVEVTKSTVL